MAVLDRIKRITFVFPDENNYALIISEHLIEFLT